MGTTLSTLDSILKNQYIGPINEQVNNDVKLLKRVEKDSESVVGKNFTIPLHVSRNEGIGVRADGGTLPTAGNQGYKESIIPMRYVYGRIELTGPTIKAAKTNEGAFIRAVESEMKGLARDLKSEFNRMLYADGTGALTVCGTTTSSTSVTVTSTAKLRVGMPIDVLVTSTGATGTGAVGRTVSSITSATVFVISGAAITTDNTYSVYRSGNRNIEVMGLSGIVSATSTLQNLDVATYPYWVASVLANGGTPRALSLSLLQQAQDIIETAGDGEASAIYTTYGVRRAYQALLQTQRYYANLTRLDGGVEELIFNNIPIIADKDAVANKLFFVDEDMLKFYQMSDFEWMQEDGAILSRVSGKDAYEAIMYKYCEFATNMRNAHSVLADITEA